MCDLFRINSKFIRGFMRLGFLGRLEFLLGFRILVGLFVLRLLVGFY